MLYPGVAAVKIDDLGEVIGVYAGSTNDTGAAIRLLRRAVGSTGVGPHTATTERAAVYPPALEQVLPEAVHVTGKAERPASECKQQHLKGRYRRMRGFKRSGPATGSCGTSGRRSTG